MNQFRIYMSETVSHRFDFLSFCCIFVAAGGEREEEEEMLFSLRNTRRRHLPGSNNTLVSLLPAHTHTHPTHITTVSGQQHVDDDYNNENALAKRRRRRRRFRLRELFTTTVWAWVGGLYRGARPWYYISISWLFFLPSCWFLHRR